MQLHQLSQKTKYRKSRRIVRGGKRGTYSGRGIKGQKARAGHKIRPEVRDLLKKIPKLRGYKFKSFRSKPTVVNLEDIEKKFKAGDMVSPQSLLEKRLVRKIKGKMPRVKILGKGKLTPKVIFKEVALSRGVLIKTGLKKAP